MTYDPRKHDRRSLRMPGYDYAGHGAYFVTICTYRRECLLGRVENDTVVLSPMGEIVREEWLRSAEIRREIALDEFVVMPNHMHGIVFIEADMSPGASRRDSQKAPRTIVGAASAPPSDSPSTGASSNLTPRSLGAMIAGFKIAAAKGINATRSTPGKPVWQRNFFEHVVRNAADLDELRRYIADNPAAWATDEENPAGTSHPTASS